MAAIRERPLPFEIFGTPADFTPEPNTVFLLGTSVEERINHVQQWQNKTKQTRFVQVIDQTRSEFTYNTSDGDRTVLLRSERQLKDFWLSLNSQSFYLDLTGFAHHVW